MFNELNLKQALSDLFDEKTFLPEGDTIGFRLLHKYPVFKAREPSGAFSGALKGVIQ